jgi:hypothetical protein
MKTRTSLIATLAILGTISGPWQAKAGFIPITVSGFNQDVVVEAGAVNDPTTHYANAVTASMDAGTAKTFYTWYETGLPGGTGGGLPAAGVFTSLADPTAQFQLSPYTGLNALLLDATTASGTLTLATPAQYSALSFLTSSSLGSATSPLLALTINFSDGTAPLTGLSVIAPDWFNNTPAALIAHGRVSVDLGTFDSVGTDNPRMYQENLALPASAASHPISSISITWLASGSPNAHTGIFAVSGTLVPEPSSVALLSTGMLALVFGTWRRRSSAGTRRSNCYQPH